MIEQVKFVKSCCDSNSQCNDAGTSTRDFQEYYEDNVLIPDVVYERWKNILES